MSRKTKQPSDWLAHPVIQTALCLLGAAFTAWQVGYFPTYRLYFLWFGIVLAVVFVTLWVCLLLTGKEQFRWILAIVFALAFYTTGVRLAASVLGDSSILLGYALFLAALLFPLWRWDLAVRSSQYLQNPSGLIIYIPILLTGAVKLISEQLRSQNTWISLMIASVIMFYMLWWAQYSCVKLLKNYRGNTKS